MDIDSIKVPAEPLQDILCRKFVVPGLIAAGTYASGGPVRIDRCTLTPKVHPAVIQIIRTDDNKEKQ